MYSQSYKIQLLRRRKKSSLSQQKDLSSNELDWALYFPKEETISKTIKAPLTYLAPIVDRICKNHNLWTL